MNTAHSRLGTLLEGRGGSSLNGAKFWARRLAIAGLAFLVLFLGTTTAGLSAAGDEPPPTSKQEAGPEESGAGNGSSPGTGAEDAVPPIPEKRDLNYSNLGSRLDQLVVNAEGGAPAQEATEGGTAQPQTPIAVTVHLSGNVSKVVTFLEDNGGDPRNVGEDYIEAYVPVALLGSLSEQPGVLSVREIIAPQTDQTGPVTGHGPPVHGSAAWNLASYTGSGIKVGVIDLPFGFNGFRGLLGTELPSTVQVRCYTEVGRFTSNIADCESSESGSEHGTLVAESVMDIAPKADLYIASPFSRGDNIKVVDWMVAQGISVIVHALILPFDGPGDGTSPFSNSLLKAIDRAVNGDIIWINSAGNSAQRTWFGSYSNADRDDWIEFNLSDECINLQLEAGDPGPVRVRVQLRWEGTWGGADSDLDLYLVNAVTRTILDYSVDPQSGNPGHVPFEYLEFMAPSDQEYCVAVAHQSGGAPDWLQVMVWGVESIQHYTGNGSIANPSESANPGMLAVGTAPWYDVHTIEPYSSRGPTPDGRIKPDVVGADCGATALRPLDEYNRGLCGTTQAASHVAGLAALVRQRFPTYTPAEVASFLKTGADPRGMVPNNIWGYGFAYLPAPVRQDSPDRDTLVALYHATGGENWTRQANWLRADAPIALWEGVTTDISGRITRLNLGHNGLTGELPTDLGDLANLEELSLWGNELTGEIPTELGSLSNLTLLNLSNNQLTGEIPTELGDLAKLEELYMGSNELAGEIPTELGDLTNLEELSLWGNLLAGEIPAELGDLTNLTVLDLRSNQLTGEIPTELGDLTNLTVLSLGGNQLSGGIPTELGGLANLENLYLWGNELTGGIPTELTSLANLKVLYLGDNQLTGQIPVELGSLTKLQELWLSKNQLTGNIPSELASLTNLEELVLWDNDLTGPVPTWLGGLSNLTLLSLGDNQLSGRIPTELGGLTNLGILSLWGNELTGEIPTELGDLANLTALSLSSNHLTGEIPTELGGLTRLGILSLWGNELTGDIPTELGSLANLTLLNLSSNQLTGDIPIELGDLTNLTALSLSSNQLTGDIPTELGDLTNLTALNLSSNQLTGDIPTELGSLSNLKELWLSENQLTGEIPTELGGLANLTVLKLSDNGLTGEIPSELGSLTNLQELWLSENQLTGEIPVELGNLANLEELYLRGNLLTGCIPTSLQVVPTNDLGQLGLPYCIPPEFSAAETGERAVAENTGPGMPIGDPVEATDADSPTLTYTLGGTDAVAFAIDPRTGQLMTKAALDHETKDSYEVVVTATDPSGESATKSVTITVTDVDEAPVLAGSTAVSYPEGGTDPVATYTATDPEDASLTWNLSGVDAAAFTITGGVLAFATSPNYEAPADADMSNDYLLTVEVSDGTNSASIDVAITVTDVDEAPVLAGSTAVSYPEGGTDPVATYTATDPEDASLTWNLSGVDAAAFTITGGVLAFATSPNYEAPADADMSNDYLLTVEVSDGTNSASIDVTITVTDVDEAPVLAGTTAVSYPEGGTDPVATYTATDPEGEAIIWSLSGDDEADFTITGGVLAFATAPDLDAPADADTDNVYKVIVEASDATQTTSVAVTVTVTADTPQTLLERYDADNSGSISKNEMIGAINDYLFGTGADAISKDQMIEVINLYLFG